MLLTWLLPSPAHHGLPRSTTGHLANFMIVLTKDYITLSNKRFPNDWSLTIRDALPQNTPTPAPTFLTIIPYDLHLICERLNADLSAPPPRDSRV